MRETELKKINKYYYLKKHEAAATANFSFSVIR